MRIFPIQRVGAFTWRAAFCASLLLAYIGFVGEAIHCQYFADQHSEHGTSSKPISHAAHCMAANHGTSAAIHSSQAATDSPLQLLTVLLTPGESRDESGIIISKTARGPPAA